MMPDPFNSNDVQDPSAPDEAEFEISTELQQAIENISAFHLNLEPLCFNFKLEPFYHPLQTYPNEKIENYQNLSAHAWFSIFAVLSIKDLALLMLTCKSIANLMAADEVTQKRFHHEKFFSIKSQSKFNPTLFDLSHPLKLLLDNLPINNSSLLSNLRIHNVVDETEIYEQPSDGKNGFTFRK